MGLDCMARDHALQQIPRETAILACTGGKAGIILSKSLGHYQCLQATWNTEIEY